MANPANWIKYKEYSGIRIRGTAPVPVPESDLHIDRAAFLATSLESPKMGAVQSYDRAAMSGGPFHFTAIQPKPMVQGSFFKLLRHLEVAAPCENLDTVWYALAAAGWYIARDGKLRARDTGKVISAHAIRDEFTPLGGKVPKTGKHRAQAVFWARVFHNLLADPTTFYAQQEFAIEYLLRGQKSTEVAYYNPFDLLSLRAIDLRNTKQAVASIMFPIDLALCVYHAHSVNAPGPAVKCLKSTHTLFKDIRFSKEAAQYLIWRLGRYKYGRWQDTTDGRNRYDHTRHAAMRSGLWPKQLFTGKTAIMPKDLSVRRPKPV